MLIFIVKKGMLYFLKSQDFLLNMQPPEDVCSHQWALHELVCACVRFFLPRERYKTQFSVFVLFCFETVASCVIQVSLELTVVQAASNSQWCASLCLPSTGVTGMYHHAQQHCSFILSWNLRPTSCILFLRSWLDIIKMYSK